MGEKCSARNAECDRFGGRRPVTEFEQAKNISAGMKRFGSPQHYITTVNGEARAGWRLPRGCHCPARYFPLFGKEKAQRERPLRCLVTQAAVKTTSLHTHRTAALFLASTTHT